jgi:XapX domain-containing protein
MVFGIPAPARMVCRLWIEGTEVIWDRLRWGSDVKVYLISLGVGVLVGVIYALLNVRSPAPPIVALIGLLGILIGEQVPTLVKHVWRGEPMVFSWVNRIRPHVFGSLPQGESTSHKAADEIQPGGGSSA